MAPLLARGAVAECRAAWAARQQLYERAAPRRRASCAPHTRKHASAGAPTTRCKLADWRTAPLRCVAAAWRDERRRRARPPPPPQRNQKKAPIAPRATEAEIAAVLANVAELCGPATTLPHPVRGRLRRAAGRARPGTTASSEALRQSRRAHPHPYFAVGGARRVRRGTSGIVVHASPPVVAEIDCTSATRQSATRASATPPSAPAAAGTEPLAAPPPRLRALCRAVWAGPRARAEPRA